MDLLKTKYPREAAIAATESPTLKKRELAKLRTKLTVAKNKHAEAGRETRYLHERAIAGLEREIKSLEDELYGDWAPVVRKKKEL